MVPNNFKPQYILHGYNDKKVQVVEQANKEGVTTIFENKKGQFGVHKYQINEPAHFFSKENIRTKIYEKIQKNKN